MGTNLYLFFNILLGNENAVFYSYQSRSYIRTKEEKYISPLRVEKQNSIKNSHRYNLPHHFQSISNSVVFINLSLPTPSSNAISFRTLVIWTNYITYIVMQTVVDIYFLKWQILNILGFRSGNYSCNCGAQAVTENTERKVMTVLQ